MKCRPGCAACCIAPSISSPLPGMPGGKPAGERCVNLDARDRCRLWGTPDFPQICRDFPVRADHCGETRAEAMATLTFLERETAGA